MTIWTQQQEAENLKKLFDELKKSKGISRAEFNRQHQIKGGANMIQQHINGSRPISIDSVLSYAEGFNLPIEKISPRIADFIKKANALQGKLAKTNTDYLEQPQSVNVATGSAWPFKSISLEEYDLLGQDDRDEIEAILKIKKEKAKRTLVTNPEKEVFSKLGVKLDDSLMTTADMIKRNKKQTINKD